ncbi:MAG: HAMP domain-containing histidine kinase [Planctomycetia bacterium]|nr:HAMP domain-containing histidine kinase [Planctomycetia bacterium]
MSKSPRRKPGPPGSRSRKSTIDSSDRLARLLRAVQDLSLARSLERVQEIVRVAARELTGADGATFVLRDGDKCHYADEDAIAPLWKGMRFPMQACISGWSMLQHEVAVIEDIYADPRIPADAYRPTFVKSLAMVPIREIDPIGAIGNYWASRHRATPGEVALLQALAQSTAVALENVKLTAELEERVRRRTAELEAANEGLRQAQAAKRQLTNMVVHDMQNPLTVIMAALELMQGRPVASGTEEQRLLEGGLAACESLMLMIQNVLSISRAETGKLEAHMADLDPLKLAGDVVKSFQGAAQVVGRVLVLEPGRAPRVRSDDALVRRILQNLLRNALRHTPPGCRILVRVGTDLEGRATIAVVDDGPGIPLEFQEEIFRPFGAAALRGKGLHVDTGLGLPTCRTLAEAVGASLRLDSDGKRGSSFTIAFP